MKSLSKVLLLLALVMGFAGVVLATNDTTQQTVTITFSEISEIAASGDPGTLTIVAPATPGTLPADQTDATTTMAWTSNVAAGQTRKITGSIDALFSGIDLFATVAAPGGASGTSANEKKFAAATTDYDFVTSIGNCNVTAQTITFRASVTQMVDWYTDATQTVTWTLTEDS
jgi:hypothetical protein